MGISRDRASIFESLSPGRADIVLDNYTGDYSPENPNGRYYGNLRPNTDIRIRATHSGSSFYLFNGFVDRWEPNPDLSQRTTHVQATDRMKDLSRRRIDTAIARVVCRRQGPALWHRAVFGHNCREFGAPSIPPER